METKAPEGPVVASGGAKIKPDAKRNAPMMEYPEGVTILQIVILRTTDLNGWVCYLHPGLQFLPMTLIMEQSNGESRLAKIHLFVQGDKTKGAPSGTQRKGMMVTSTGIVFATAKGGKVYAFDVDNGNILWETTLNHESNAQPSMYTLNGKQYLVINATSDFTPDSYDHSKKPGALPKGYVVYALPMVIDPQ